MTFDNQDVIKGMKQREIVVKCYRHIWELQPQSYVDKTRAL